MSPQVPAALPAVGRGDEPFNIAAFLPAQAQRRPYQKVVIFPEGRTADGQRCYSHFTYLQLEQHSNRLVVALRKAGIGRGVRTLLMVRPGPTFISLTFALFKIGAVPILIDPGMGKANLLDSIAAVSPQAMVAIPLAHAARCRYPGSFRTVETLVTVGRRWFWGGHTLDGLLDGVADTPEVEMAPTLGRDPAAILYTTGSTGPPKGVAYEHQMFGAQVEAIRAHYGIEEGEVDLPCLPLFVLFSVALGVTSVIPDMDPTKPASCDPALLVEAIQDHGVTYSFGSPAIWNRVGPYCVRHGITLGSLRRVLMAGAPVPERVVRPMLAALGPDADIHTPYGATESLPVASFNGRAALETFPRTDVGAGVCVGSALPGVELRVIKTIDGPIATWDQVELLPAGEIGEICVKGQVVTREYAFNEAATTKHKIADGDGFWHRIGDCGYLDDEGRLWFCGRAGHRVITPDGPMYTVPCEAIYNTHAAVFRSALVGVGARPVICVELEPGTHGSPTLKSELLALGKQHDHTAKIADLLFHPAFPVDIRHNAKIFREKLAVWAAGQL